MCVYIHLKNNCIKHNILLLMNHTCTHTHTHTDTDTHTHRRNVTGIEWRVGGQRKKTEFEINCCDIVHKGELLT